MRIANVLLSKLSLPGRRLVAKMRRCLVSFSWLSQTRLELSKTVCSQYPFCWADAQMIAQLEVLLVCWYCWHALACSAYHPFVNWQWMRLHQVESVRKGFQMRREALVNARGLYCRKQLTLICPQTWTHLNGVALRLSGPGGFRPHFP